MSVIQFRGSITALFIVCLNFENIQSIDFNTKEIPAYGIWQLDDKGDLKSSPNVLIFNKFFFPNATVSCPKSDKLRREYGGRRRKWRLTRKTSTSQGRLCIGDTIIDIPAIAFKQNIVAVVV
ncbi:hypothetical protein J6590_084675 [Homalodisca vitripennis]|nr:hypothetical protein J6590_084675 [Homalodisca vitripennis]